MLQLIAVDGPETICRLSMRIPMVQFLRDGLQQTWHWEMIDRRCPRQEETGKPKTISWPRHIWQNISFDDFLGEAYAQGQPHWPEKAQSHRRICMVVHTKKVKKHITHRSSNMASGEIPYKWRF